MATDRVISATTTSDVEERANWALRPLSIDEYVGQDELLTRLRIAIRAARERGDPLEHLLLHGPPGLGKTTLAHIIAQEMGSKLHVTSGPILAKGTDLVAALTRLSAGDVLFIDEIHRLPIAVEEFIYPAMEDFRIEVTVDSGLNARTVQIKCKPFTLVGATTRAGLLSSPLRSRFGLSHHLRYYTEGELLSILRRSSSLLGMEAVVESGLMSLARRSRGTPRIANRLLRRVRDYSQVVAKGECTNWHVFVLIADKDHVVFRARREHSSETVQTLLGGFRGFLLSDAATIYDCLYRGGGIRAVNCWAHLRRYFWRARSSDPKL